MISITKRRLANLASASAIIATLAVAIVPAATFAAGPVFENGSFEQGLTPWTDTSIDRTDIWEAKDGEWSIDLNGFTPGAIAQSFPTNVGSMYVVQFSMSGNPGTHEQFPNGDASPSLKEMTVHATGGSTRSYSFNTALKGNSFGDMKWVDEAYSFRATDANTTLTFASTIEGAFGPAIDKVTITETLPTGAQCKNDGWKAMFDRNGTDFRNQGDCVSYYATGEKNLAN